MNKSKRSNKSSNESSTDDSNPPPSLDSRYLDEVNESKDAQTPEVHGIRSMSEIIASHRKTREQQIDNLQSLLEAQSLQLQEIQKALQLSQAQQQETNALLKRQYSDTPSPNQNSPSPDRPQDVAYRQAIASQEAATSVPEVATNPEQAQFLQFVGDIVKAITKKDTSDIESPPKFSGNDDEWEAWYKQLRAYLQAKGWLSTFDHPTGPGSPGFDIDVNNKIYTKLQTLCAKGKAATYVDRAAAFNGHGAGQELVTTLCRLLQTETSLPTQIYRNQVTAHAWYKHRRSHRPL
jgi:hypothetical protein